MSSTLVRSHNLSHSPLVFVKRVKLSYLQLSQESAEVIQTDYRNEKIFDKITTNKNEHQFHQTLVQFLQHLVADRIGSQGTRVHSAMVKIIR
jgi:hypothetical protein